MHVLAVISHPNKASFSHAVLKSFVVGVEEAGLSYDIADLYKEGFSPVLSERDLLQFKGVEMPDDILAYQARVEKADALCLIFPTWWYGMPAMMKGWLDRVWSAGWAYDWKHDPEGSLLPPRPCTLLIPTGVSEKMESEWRCVEKLTYIYRQGVLGYCGVDPIEIHFMLDAAEYGQGHEKHLQTALEAGKNILKNQ